MEIENACAVVLLISEGLLEMMLAACWLDECWLANMLAN
jgi:hypothetical protein